MPLLPLMDERKITMNDEYSIDLKRLYFIIRRHFVFICAVVFIFFAAAIVYVKTEVPRYTAQTLLLLDKGITESVSDISSLKQMGFEPSAIESEVEVIRSRRVSDVAFAALRKKGYFSELDEKKAEEKPQEQAVDAKTEAADDKKEEVKKTPEEIKQEEELAAKAEQEAKELAKAEAKKKKAEKEAKIQAIHAQMLKNLNVSRVGQTYILSIRYTSSDPVQAADFANAFAEAYISDQMNSLSETSSRTVSWLQVKTEEIRAQLQAARDRFAKYKADYNQQARKRSSVSITDREFALSELKSLENEVQTYSSLYDSYLQKLENIRLEQSFPVINTRVITYASPPTNKSHPKTLLILGAALIFGGGAAFMIALIMDNFDRTLRRAGQVKREIGVPFLGFFPKLNKANRESMNFISASGDQYMVNLYTQSIEGRFSLCTDTIRAIKNAVDHKMGDRKHKVIGVISAHQNEGVSMIASSLALYSGLSGDNTILIDHDLRNSTPIKGEKEQSYAMTLSHVLHGQGTLDQAVLINEAQNLAILPSVVSDNQTPFSHLSAVRVKKLVEQLAARHEYVIVDLPPLVATADVYSFAEVIDTYVVVAEWGKTLPNSLNFYLEQNGIPQDKILGLVLNKADMAKMKKFYGHKVYNAK